jgi:hypothetical protein
LREQANKETEQIRIEVTAVADEKVRYETAIFFSFVKVVTAGLIHGVRSFKMLLPHVCFMG